MDRDQAIIKMYREGSSLRAVGKAYGVSHQTVANILEEHGEPLRGRGGARPVPKKKRRRLPLDQIVIEFVRSSGTEDERLRYLSEKYNIEWGQLRQAMLRRGVIEPRPLGRKPSYEKEN